MQIFIVINNNNKCFICNLDNNKQQNQIDIILTKCNSRSKQIFAEKGNWIWQNQVKQLSENWTH